MGSWDPGILILFKELQSIIINIYFDDQLFGLTLDHQRSNSWCYGSEKNLGESDHFFCQ